MDHAVVVVVGICMPLFISMKMEITQDFYFVSEKNKKTYNIRTEINALIAIANKLYIESNITVYDHHLIFVLLSN